MCLKVVWAVKHEKQVESGKACPEFTEGWKVESGKGFSTTYYLLPSTF